MGKSRNPGRIRRYRARLARRAERDRAAEAWVTALTEEDRARIADKSLRHVGSLADLAKELGAPSPEAVMLMWRSGKPASGEAPDEV